METISAQKTPKSGLERRLESKTRKALYEFDLIEEKKIAIALSGGKDSITLLHLLKQISGRGIHPFEIVPIHVTGEFSCGPSVQTPFIKQFCEGNGLDLIVLESKQTREGLNCYSCSRERRRLIFDAAKESGCETVAFGHHADDSIETLMLNLLHKGEFAANLPKVKMVDYGVTIIRPLIYAWEEEIAQFARQKGFLRVSCQCPVGAVSKRRDVKEIIQGLESAFPHVRENLAFAAKRYGSDKASRK